jgi:hypothetical protein
VADLLCCLIQDEAVQGILLVFKYAVSYVGLRYSGAVAMAGIIHIENEKLIKRKPNVCLMLACIMEIDLNCPETRKPY